jgi:hypothetical protein
VRKLKLSPAELKSSKMGFKQAYTLSKYTKIRAEGAENFGFFLGKLKLC